MKTASSGVRARRARPRLLAALTAIALAAGGAVAVTAPPAAAAEAAFEHRASSPDGSLTASVGIRDGRLSYDVVRDGSVTVVAPSGLGFVLRQPAVDLTRDIEIVGTRTAEVDETWTPAWGTVSSVRNHAEELTVEARHRASGVRFDVTFRVFDDGVGFRYTFPEQAALPPSVAIASERTEFSLPADLTAYSIAAGTRWDADERHYRTTPITQVANAQTPITFSRADGLFLALHEADLTDYASMTVVRDAAVPGRLVSDLIRLPNGDRAVIDPTGGFDTPWRTLTVGRDAGDLAESHLVLNLNDPCAICDVDSDGDGVDDTADWIDSGTYTGVWWELQRRATTWNAGPNHGATTERVMEYIDLAAEAGASYVLAEGWNVNAGGTWQNQDFLTPMPDFDLPAVLDYAEANGVGYTMHNETRGYVDYYDAHVEEIFAQYEEWGIHSVKTGYATRFELGGVNRSHYDQEAVRHYQRVIDTAARHRINLNAHEAIKPTGKERTYPNMMTGEGVAGMEQQNYMGANGNPPEQATILPFTRWIGGPADYTPGVLNVTWDPAGLNTRVQTTTAAQLALYTTFYSPLQMLADTPENYAQHADAFAYLHDMPTTWDDSRVDAEIGDWIVTSRRSGDDWYTGVVVDELDRSVDVPLDFLEPDVTYAADVYADAADASWRGNPTSVEVTRVLVTADDVLRADVVGAGGQAYRFSPATRADLARLDRVVDPGISYGSDFESTFDPAANTVEIVGHVRNTGSLVGSHPVALELDGRVVAEASVRVPGAGEAEVRFTLDYDFPARAQHRLVLTDGGDVRGDAADVELAPPFGDAEAREVLQLVDRRQVRGATAEALARDARLARQHFQSGDRAAVTRAVQDLRITLLLAPTDEANPGVRTRVERLLTETLGEPIGLAAALVPLAQVADRLDDPEASALRDAARRTVDAALNGDTAASASARTEMIALLEGVRWPRAQEMREALEALGRSVSIEAETARRLGSAAVTTEHPGYTGTGFVRSFTSIGAGIEMTIPSGMSGEYAVSIRYANGMVIAPLDRQLSFSANGEPALRVAFPNRGQDANRWRNWGFAPGPDVTAVEGENRFVLIYAAGDSGNVNVDRIDFVPVSGFIPRPVG